MYKILLIIFLSQIILLGNSINIAVAANVSYAIKPLIEEFNKIYPKKKIRVTLGSSGKLTAQIQNGAPYSLFMSANMKYPNTLYKNNIALEKPIIYAEGSIAIISAKKRDFSNELDLLKDSSLKRVAIANPKTAPYGIATVEALKNAKLYNFLKSKFVYGESISQTFVFALKAADLGFVAKSSLFDSKMKRFKENIHWKTLNPNLYTPIKQGVALLKEDAKEFYNFLQSSNAKKIFQNYGYIVYE